MPTPVCRFGRAYTCSRFRGQAAFGRDPGSKATCYGFRDHLRISWPGVLTAISETDLSTTINSGVDQSSSEVRSQIAAVLKNNAFSGLQAEDRTVSKNRIAVVLL